MNQPTIILRRLFAYFHLVRVTMCAISAFGFVLTACGGGNGDEATPPPAAPSASITTVAGTGSAGFNGDNQSAISARLNFPAGIAADTAGNVLIVDAGNHRIRRVDAQTGIIVTVAGNGVICMVQPCGDGGQAALAQIHSPLGIAVDAAGNVLIADQNNHRVRRVDAQTGIITTVAGTGSAGFNGDNQPAIAAHLNFPTGVAADVAGNLFIADQSNHRVRRVDGQGNITTVAGIGTPCANPSANPACGDGGQAVIAQLNVPTGVAVDVAGNLFIADQNNHRVRRVDVQGNITTVAGTGNAGFNGDNQPAIASQLNVPTGVSVDTAGNVIIADQFNQRVRVVNAQTGIITTVAGNGTACANPIATPACGDGGLPTAAQLNLPNGVTLDRGGHLLIADFGNHRVRRVMP